VGRLIARWLERTAIELHLQRLLVRIGKALVLLFTLILALDKFGVQVTSLVASISVAGVAASFAVQGVLANVAAGLSIMLSRHFKIGDSIEVGTVREQVQASLDRFAERRIALAVPRQDIRLLGQGG
jgi:small conductance mechanosensitive channel